MKYLLVTLKRFLIPLLLAVIAWLWLTQAGVAQVNDIRLESRVDRLESQLSRVRSQITRLETQISGSSRPAPSPSADTNFPLDELSLEEQFDNLAVLAIELKQDLRQLEEEVAELEQIVRSEL